jgi:hypothetical protein
VLEGRDHRRRGELADLADPLGVEVLSSRFNSPGAAVA